MKKPKKLTKMLELKIKLEICPRCGFKTGYNYFNKKYCCTYCAYPGGELASFNQK